MNRLKLFLLVLLSFPTLALASRILTARLHP